MTHLRRQNFYALPSAHWNLLAQPPFSILDTLSAVDDAIDANADLAEAIFRTAAPNFSSHSQTPPSYRGTATPADMDKARSTLRQLHRDWSTAGAPERTACYGPILSTLNHEHASTPRTHRDSIRVLVPGAGLGRLVLDLTLAGFTVEGNEISYHQLLASAFVLNHTTRADEFEIFPWALGFSNHVSRADQLRGVRVPDVHPAEELRRASEGCRVHAFERMSVAAADFCVAYAGEENRGVFDAVATVFFVDTAPNAVRYVEAVANCLRSGGIWVNLGPLLWHFENEAPKGEGAEGMGIGESGSVELTDDEVVALVERFGFVVERREVSAGVGAAEGRGIETGYISDPRSMLRTVYRPSFWVARKL